MNPILIDLPMPIVTDRLVIRPTQTGDGKALNEAILETFEDLKLWIPRIQTRPSLDESEVVVRSAAAKWLLREDLMMLIFDKSSGDLIGATGLHRMDWDVPRFEIGYWVRKKCMKKGYITESTAALTAYTFKQLKARRVEIRCDPENTRSSAVPQRLGYRLEATFKQDSLKFNTREVRDTSIFVRNDDSNLLSVNASW